MKNNLYGAKRHRILLTSLSALSAFIMFAASFTAAAFGTDTDKEERSELIVRISDSLLRKDTTEGDCEVASPAVHFEEVNNTALTVNNEPKNVETKEGQRETLVNLSEFLITCRPSCTVSSGAAFEAVDAGLELYIEPEANCIVANGRYLWCNGGIIYENGDVFVPASVASRIVCATSSAGGKSVNITLKENERYIESGEDFYNSDDIYWLSRIICAESRGEVLEGKIAVGNVVLNRVCAAGYPDSIYGVIFDSSAGVQFSPAANGSIYNEPTADCVVAAKLCLEGVSVSNEILYFFNPATADNFWVADNRTYITTIGNHAFYS